MKNCRMKGFTFVETMVSLLIVTLLSVTVMTGIRIAWSVHENALFSSESEILADTINTSLGDLLHYASYDQTDPDSTVQFSSQEYGVLKGSIYIDKGRLYVKTSSEEKASQLRLVNEGAYTSIDVETFRLSYDSENNQFIGSYILKGSKAQTKEITFTFESINQPAVIPSNS